MSGVSSPFRRSIACAPTGCSTSSRSCASAKKPVTAAALADELEVTVRTIYRDVATLQARRVPIEGAPGLGYVLRKGFDLPPLMFTVDEVEAITVGARLVQRLRDSELQQAAKRVLDKVTVVLPESLRSHVTGAPFYVSRRRRRHAERRRCGAGAQRHPRSAQDAHLLRRREKQAHAAHDLAARHGLLRRRDADRRVVRAPEGFQEFPRRADRGVTGAGAALPGSQRTKAGRMAGAAQGSARTVL